eukprot:scaffold116650_cov30-Attheya_sp.AAC.1
MLTLASGHLPFLAMFRQDSFGVPPLNILAAIISCDRACTSFPFLWFQNGVEHAYTVLKIEDRHRGARRGGPHTYYVLCSTP